MGDYLPSVKGPAWAGLAWVAALLGGWDVPMQTLALLNGVDILTGVAKAVYLGRAASDRCAIGVVKKFTMWLFVMTAVALDSLVLHVAQQDPHLRLLVILGWVVTESISIAENGRAMGLDLPPGFYSVLEGLRPKGRQDPPGPGPGPTGGGQAP